MALLTLLPSTALYAEGSQTIPTVNALIGQLNGNAGIAALANGSFAANGSVATVLGSLGPTGSHVAVQKWLQIVDNTGTVGWIPIF
jgi:hypothetical protein